MTRILRTRLTMTTALAALLLPAATGGALAQVSGFSIEVSPSADQYTPVRIGARVFGTAVESAATFVRGCQGSVLPEAAGAAFDVTAGFDTLTFTGAGAGLRSLVLGTPDGLYRCALADDQGFVATNLSGVGAGRYTVWLGADEGAAIDAQLYVSQSPVSAIELFGLDVARLGEPRAGRLVYAAAGIERQELVMGGQVYAESEMRPLDAAACWGYGRLDAADVVLTLDQASERFSLFATSDLDLVMAVVDPAGNVHCNDDAYQLHPGVTIEGAQAGDYHVFVGSYSPDGQGVYDLFASEGMPAFGNADVDLTAPPRNGYVAFDMNAAGQGQLLVAGSVNAYDPVEMLPTGTFCAGFTDLSAPDVVMSLDSAQPMISIYSRSASDLTMAVRAPDGSWSCSDDMFELNPGVSLTEAQPGEYMIWMGAYNPGDMAGYNLYASMGSPNWGATSTDGTGGSDDMAPVANTIVLDVLAEPARGHVDFSPETRIDPRVILDIAASTTDAFGMADGCLGFITPSRPDVVIDAAAGLPQLMVYMVSEVDGTLIVQGPDGQLYCNDDFEMLNPGVMIQNPAPGAYSVFAGSYAGAGGPATLGVTIASPAWVMDREN